MNLLVPQQIGKLAIMIGDETFSYHHDVCINTNFEAIVSLPYRAGECMMQCINSV